ncbi:hypothetical protein ABT300_20560 [Streptomyces sp. NPDC001027]|uniref:hypothetical protein n=1 Tax=Streptomyces sp. NPDC001027 TaxID=3154771 RepID=UPI003322F842
MPTRPTPPTRRRVRLLAVALTAAAALALTACRDGEGLRDEGPSSSSTLNGSGPLPGSLTGSGALTGSGFGSGDRS